MSGLGILLAALVAGCSATAADGGNPMTDAMVDHDAAATDAEIPVCQRCTTISTAPTSSWAAQPLACACSGGATGTGECPATIDEMRARLVELKKLCNYGMGIVRISGCGQISYRDQGLGGQGWTFDAQSGRLVGAYNFSDTGFGVCAVNAYRRGEGFWSCANVEMCALCGAPQIPACAAD